MIHTIPYLNNIIISTFLILLIFYIGKLCIFVFWNELNKYRTMKHIVKYIKFILPIILLSGCLIVKQDSIEESKQIVKLSPKPEVQMSEEIVRSKEGDMIAFIPKDWFFVNVEDKASTDVYAVAVNPDYTLAAIFSTIRKNKQIDDIVNKENVIGLARVFFEKHQNKTAGNCKQLGSVASLNMGPLLFGKYNYTSGSSKNRAAVFISSLGNYYEFAMVQMDFRGKPIPDQADIDKIFNSILATIQY